MIARNKPAVDADGGTEPRPPGRNRRNVVRVLVSYRALLRGWAFRPSDRLPRLVFTETGIAALRAMMNDRRFADPKKFAHVRQELGIDPVPETEVVQD